MEIILNVSLITRMNDVAEKLKAEANDFFKKQNYEAAIALYNKVSNFNSQKLYYLSKRRSTLLPRHLFSIRIAVWLIYDRNRLVLHFQMRPKVCLIYILTKKTSNFSHST